MASNEATEKLRKFLQEGAEKAKDPQWIAEQRYKEERKRKEKEIRKRYGL